MNGMKLVGSSSELGALGDTATPVDLRQLMSSEPPEQEWLVEPLLLARKLTSIVSKRGVGKSLLALDIVARLATGQATLDQSPSEPVHIVYIDQEMGPDDLWGRLSDLGWDPDNPLFDTLVDNLHYYQLVDLPPLDTRDGGEALENIVSSHDACLVVIDTVSRVIEGNEDSSDTFRNMFRHSLTRFKRAGVTMLLLDHLGKDASRGSRGSSGKEDALDVVWQLKTTSNEGLQLDCTKSRPGGIPQRVTVMREHHNGILNHVVPTAFVPDRILELMERIDQLGLPVGAGTPTVQKALQEVGEGRRRTDIAAAVRFRKAQARGVVDRAEHPGTTLKDHSPDHKGTYRQKP